MESLLEKHKDNTAIQVIHFPHELNRKETLLKGEHCVCVCVCVRMTIGCVY